MDTNETGTAACVDGHAGAVDVQEIRYTIGHNGNAIASCSVDRRIVGVTQDNLLIIWILLDDCQTRVTSRKKVNKLVPFTKEPIQTPVSLFRRGSRSIPAAAKSQLGVFKRRDIGNLLRCCI